MTDQLTIFAKQDPDALIEQARVQYAPIRPWYCLFSGGNDSSVLAHRCRDEYDALVFIDTGTAVPGVLEFVREYAAWLDKPLKVYEAGAAFRDLVLQHGGFPGPAGHGRAYTRLKERQIEALVRDTKTGMPRRSTVMLLTGKRRAESARRARTTLGIDKRGGQLYVNPLVDWTAYDMRAYRHEHALPENPVAALLHRSGECNCGAFADQGEREMLRDLYPDWFRRTIETLERDAQAAGIKCATWGQRCGGETQTHPGLLCSSCEWHQEAMEVAA